MEVSLGSVSPLDPALNDGESGPDSGVGPGIGSCPENPIPGGVRHARVLAIISATIRMRIRPARDVDRHALEHSLDQFDQLVLDHRNSLVAQPGDMCVVSSDAMHAPRRVHGSSSAAVP